MSNRITKRNIGSSLVFKGYNDKGEFHGKLLDVKRDFIVIEYPCAATGWETVTATIPRDDIANRIKLT